MNTLSRIASLSLLTLALWPSPGLRADGPRDCQPELFQKTRLVYEDTFDKGPINPDFWEIRQNTTWEIKDGVLTGAESSKEFQSKKKASDDPSHAGLKPVIWLKQVPESFVCTMRVRHDAEACQNGFPLLDLGHHIHTITFSEKATTLKIKKDVGIIAVEAPLFSLNAWHDVAIELKKGAIHLTIDGKKHLFESPEIDMAGQAQIDFKGIDFGTCQIDRLRLWEGL